MSLTDMAFSGIKKSWETMLRFFRDKEWRQAAVDEALGTVAPHVESMINKRTGAGLTGAEQEQNAFNSHEAALQRDWSAQEAERARDWQEEMYAKYNSLSGKIAQAEQAGVNPMLAVTGNAVSPMSASPTSPSGAYASAGGFASRSFTDLVGTVLGLVKSKSEINLMDSEAERNRADANKTSTETSWIDRLSQAQLDNLVASKEELESRLGVNSETANKLRAEFGKLVQESARLSQITDVEKRKLEAEAELARWTADNRDLLLALDVGTDVLNNVTQLASTIIEVKAKVPKIGKK